MKKITKRQITTVFLMLAVSLISVLMLAFPTDSSSAARDGLNIVLNVLVPSLFPFMAVSVFLTESGLSRYVFKIPSIVISKITGLNEYYCDLFLIGMVGGYPSASKNISVCVKNGEIDQKTAEILLCFCTNAGPSFLITAVGSRMFLNSDIGLILYLASLLSSLTLLAFYSHKIEKLPLLRVQNKSNYSQKLLGSVKSSCKSMSMIAALVVIFSVMTSFIEKYISISDAVNSLLIGFLEVTFGCIKATYDTTIINVLLASAICGFGGICVILQIKSIVSEYNIPIKKFIVSRILNAILNLTYTYLLLSVFPIRLNQTFISNTQSAVPEILTSPIPALMLLMCCVCLPMCISKRKKL